MKNLILAIALMAAVPAYASEKPPTEASIRELLTLSDAKNLVEGVYQQTDAMMEKMFKEAVGDKSLNDEQQRLFTEMRSKIVALMFEDLGWEKLEPVYIKLYTDTFSQADIDGIIEFYKTKAGASLLKKMPLLVQNLMQFMSVQMQSLMPKVRALTEEYTRKVVEAGKAGGQSAPATSTSSE